MSTIFEEVEAGIKGRYFTPPKPKNEQDDNDRIIIAELESKNKLMIQRKHDGNGHIIAVGKKLRQTDIYTLGLNHVGNKYPHLRRSLNAVRFPGNTLMCGEIFCTVGGIHDRYEATKFTNFSVSNALKYRKSSGICPTIALFNTLIWNGEDATKWSNHDRYFCVLEHLKSRRAISHVQMTELIETSLEEGRRIVEEQKWEGLVLYDRDATTQFALGRNGKPPTIPRPPGSWKDKKGIEVDFVAYGFVRSEAKSHENSVKDFYIGLIDPNTGELIPCGKCGNGLSRQDRFKFIERSALPVAVEIKFEQWSKYGKTLLGRIIRVRDPKDKHFKQCVATEEQLQKWLTKERVKPMW